MSDEPTAIRYPKHGKAHRLQGFGTACQRRTPAEVDRMERVPLSQTDPADRCRICWPATKGASDA